LFERMLGQEPLAPANACRRYARNAGERLNAQLAKENQ
jgi:hypothetical protein